MKIPKFEDKKIRQDISPGNENTNADIIVTVPGSKSITNRALLLAALSHSTCILKGVLFSEDSRAVLDCLQVLGFEIVIEEEQKQVTIRGMGGRIPRRQVSVNVRSAGTAARFLTVMLAFAGGEYTLHSSQQMKKRPMEPLINALRKMGAEIICLEEEGHFPFVLRSGTLNVRETVIETGVSSQFASALLMAGTLLGEGLTIHMQGSRVLGSYIRLTLRMMEQFGINVKQQGNSCVVPHMEQFGLEEYEIEPDISGACYFYGMAPLLQRDVTVRKVERDSMQGDIQFLDLLAQLGCRLEDRPEGLTVIGRHVTSYPGLSVDMKDFSDQTMTLAVLAPFAKTPTLIRNIGHIRHQESDRISAILTELTGLGIRCEEVPEEEGIRIYPGTVTGGEVETYEDHRMAMAFTLIGLKTGTVSIQNPGCCAKTFENYFDLIHEITGRE